MKTRDRKSGGPMRVMDSVETLIRLGGLMALLCQVVRHLVAWFLL